MPHFSCEAQMKFPFPCITSECLFQYERKQNEKQTPWLKLASELHRPSGRRLLARLVPPFADRGCCVVSTKDSYDHIHGFLDRSYHLFFPSSSSITLTRLRGSIIMDGYNYLTKANTDQSAERHQFDL
jgi:hypothetical protein